MLLDLFFSLFLYFASHTVISVKLGFPFIYICYAITAVIFDLFLFLNYKSFVINFC